MIRTVILALLLLATSVCANSSKSTDQYLLTLPDGWMQVSAESMEMLTQDLYFTALPHANQKCAYLYQRVSHDSLFTLPYMLVQINDAPRITEKELQSFGSKYFTLDPATNILWGFRDSTLDVIIPTSHGSINVFCYSSKKEFPANKQQFVEIIRSLSLRRPFVYERSFFRDLPFVDYLFRDYGINGVLLAVFFAALIVARLRSRK